MVPAAKAHHGWMNAYDRASATILDRPLPEHLVHISQGVSAFFSTVGWDVPIGPFDLSTRHLIPLFSDAPLNDKILNSTV